MGSGKSATLKAFCHRQLVFGRQAWLLDPRGEYDKLCAAVGVSPVHLRPGGAARLNPLAPRVGGDEHPHDLRGRLAPAGEDRDDGVKRILVVDEAWKVLTRLEVARWLQENWKLTRSTAVHRSIADAIAATVVP